MLLDGKRLPISSSSGVVDTNILKTAIIKDIEVITGGASAVYGSDAVSGVVNFITVNDYEGLKVDVQYGNSMKNDHASYDASILTGSSFDKGHVLFSVSASVAWCALCQSAG